MKISALLTRNNDKLHGLCATVRIGKNTREVINRVKPGEIAVINEIDLDCATAEELVEKKVSAVVNISTYISGRYPNLGPQVLVDAGILLIENAGMGAVRKIKDGAKISICEGDIYHGTNLLLSGHELDKEEVGQRIIAAKRGISDHLEAFASNTIEFIRSEAPLFIDGIGIPDVDVNLKGRYVVIVTDGPGHREDLKALRPFIREYRPVMIGVNRGAHAIAKAGSDVHIVVGNPELIGTNTLRSARSVIIPAEPDGRVQGLHRIQDLGIGAMTFPARGQAADLALILAEHHGAELIVVIGQQATFQDFFDSKRASSNPSTYLTRLKMGHKLVDGKAVANLYQNNIPLWLVTFFVIAAIIAVIAVLSSMGIIDLYAVQQWLIEQANNLYSHSSLHR